MILLLAAHFSRADSPVLMLAVLGFPFLFFLRKVWTLQVLQVVAYTAAVIWIFSAYEYMVIRISEGHDWQRLLIILFSVAIYSAWTGYFVNSKKMRQIYTMKAGENESEPEEQ